MNADCVLVAHGGAGAWHGRDAAAVAAGLRRAAARGEQLLSAGASALDAVVAVVAALEDDSLFNAGTGAVLNADGEAELDAALVCGHELRAGAVACLRRVRNPVLVAQAVLQRTRHVLLAGDGALRFARSQGFADYDPTTPERRAQWLAAQSAPAQRGDVAESGDTVGAVAMDSAGRFAAANSTGGTSGKLAGRVGDSPLLGAGLYATAHGAAAATGHGEIAMRCLSARSACEHLARGASAQQALSSALEEARAALKLDTVPLGLIAIDRSGSAGVMHGTAAMPHAIWRFAQSETLVRMRA